MPQYKTPSACARRYAVNKDPSYFNLTLTQKFLDRVKGFQFLNLIRCALAWVGWFLVRGHAARAG